MERETDGVSTFTFYFSSKVTADAFYGKAGFIKDVGVGK